VQQAEEALRHTQKMAELGHLTGGVAHDFNNLLGAMIGSFELIRRKHDDPERVRMLADAGLLVAERGARLTAQLLMFSRAQPIKLTPVSISAVVDGMREMLRRTLGPLIDVNIDISCGRSFILSDRTQLEMALLNLAINARDAMPEGGLLTIAATLDTVAGDPALEPGEYVELLVRDTGIGMSPDVASRAFDPFFTTKGIGQGTGLGLSQVHGLARQAGGAVRIESQPGRGTTIRMLLPCTDAPFLFERPAQIPPEQGEPQDATVLLVDDDQDLRSVLAASLQDLGYSVIEAVDGAEGLVLLEQHEPDLLVADFAMPGMSGAELARSARLLHPGLPIIFASGLTERLDIETAAGPDTRVLRKPFRISELQREIQGALSARA
jgi:CheY-like chemotaxis protein/anti-sigma regulatory factor (Ser/Thr protein kinase)